MPREGIMLCYPFEEKRLSRWGGTPVLVQPKLDGDRCRAIVKAKQVELYSSQCNLFEQIPHINKQLADLFAIDEEIELDGELFMQTGDHSDIHSIASRKVNQSAESERLEYWIFDIIENFTFKTRHQVLITLNDRIQAKGVSPNIKIVPTIKVDGMEGIMYYMNQFVDDGFEGIIIRNPEGMYKRKRSTDIMKFKPHREMKAVIIAAFEESSKDGVLKGALGAFTCRVPDTDPNESPKFFNVGTGPLLTKAGRAELWQIRNSLIGKVATIKYQNTTNGGVPRFPVLVGIE